jgi:hypothetical protein
MSTENRKELWMRESTKFTLSNNTIVDGFRIVFVRFLEDDETLNDIDDSEEFMDVVSGGTLPMNVDSDYNEIDGEILDDDIDMLNPTFYIGDGDGRPV